MWSLYKLWFLFFSCAKRQKWGQLRTLLSVGHHLKEGRRKQGNYTDRQMLKCYYYFQTKVCCTLHHTPGNLSHSLKYPSFQHKHNISHDNDQGRSEVARQPLPTIALRLCVYWCVLVQCDGAIVWNFSLCLPNTQIHWPTFQQPAKIPS